MEPAQGQLPSRLSIGLFIHFSPCNAGLKNAMVHMFPTLVMDSVSEKKDIGDGKSRKSRGETRVAWMPFNQRLPGILEVRWLVCAFIKLST